MVTIFGKSWDLHVTHALGTTLEENLAMIGDSVAYPPQALRGGHLRRRAFLRRLQEEPGVRDQRCKAAEAAGAHCLVLCDTNGGGMPHEVVGDHPRGEEAREGGDPARHPRPQRHASAPWPTRWPRCSEGVDHVQGTINGYGERCGNANLVSIIPNLMLKMGLDCIPQESLRELRDVSRFVSELANRKPWGSQPYVGDSAFAHKGGIHVSAVLKHAGDLRARRSRSGGQPPARAGLGAGRPVEHAVEGEGVRHRPRQEHARVAAHPRDAEAAWRTRASSSRARRRRSSC